jgi:hypothetical protein
MFSSKGRSQVVTLLAILALISSPVFSSSNGTVGYGLKWQSNRASYTFVFSGQVMRQGRPCPNARISLDIETSYQGVVSQIADAGDDGRYQIAITVAGVPDQSSIWRLQARVSGLKESQTGEAEGRIILMDGQTTVIVSETIRIEQA